MHQPLQLKPSSTARQSYFELLKVSTLSLAFACILFSKHAHSELSTQQQKSKTEGIKLYNQYKAAEMQLRIAAEAGDAEAQFYLAEELRKKKRYSNKEEKKWYEASASQGDYYAMFKLATTSGDLCSVINQCPPGSKKPSEWLDLLIKTATPRAVSGDAEAMAILYNATAELKWLEKSAAAGYAPSQWLLANRYAEGEGTFILPWKRKNAEEELLKSASEGGYPPAMIEYISILFQRNDLESVRYWWEVAAKTGYQAAVASYGAYLSHTPDKVGYSIDLVKGYALVSLLKELDGGGNIQAYVEGKLPQIAEKMTPAQIEEAKKYAIEWKATHPPLSFFPEKIGF
ncbi:sel1 repeat family protein [Pseudomonas sp. AKS31]|uniref:tetratricopeptide repeat protein n=1 Tax=Pseudomonas sp. AKS31 TaxID=2949091 RepID=UPI002029BCD8|nr:sel1 repeat family protein [Pseudomonas sp. AKS31]MCL9800381.1 sel1 repeat family protein [Pseudomonas sp. AKS31]